MDSCPLDCERCGAAIPEDAPFGRCPACGRACDSLVTIAETEIAVSDTSVTEDSSLATRHDNKRLRQDPGTTKLDVNGQWEPPLPEEIDRLLPDKYEVTGLLGRGGMGAVYRGRQLDLDRNVAIKVLPEAVSLRDDHGAPENRVEFIARFELEAKSMARMDHPAILTIYDFGRTHNGQLYFVMEFVDGLDLSQFLEANDGRIEWSRALAILADVLEALDCAHSHGIIHRDIKPANVLISHKGRVKIGDFGIAKHISVTGNTSFDSFTSPNIAMGTPAYAAPELYQPGTSVDHRVDLYAVGAMLFHLLTGAPPRGQFRLPSSVIQGLDKRVDSIIGRALQPDPVDRYQTAREFLVDVQRLLPAHRMVSANQTGKPEANEVPADLEYPPENVQFTVYRPRQLSLEETKLETLLVFTHLEDNPLVSENDLSPLEQVRREAQEVLGEKLRDYADKTKDSLASIPREAEITLLPSAGGRSPFHSTNAELFLD